MAELQGLLSASSEQYGKLEEKMAAKEAKHKEEMAARGEAVTALRKELEDANKLVKTFQGKGLSDDAVECLSPSAAAASRYVLVLYVELLKYKGCFKRSRPQFKQKKISNKFCFLTKKNTFYYF